MLGGYQILDLTNINLELGADAVDITDSGVLKQLLSLREYIEKGYDFSRPLNNQLKPFQVRYRDKKADEEITATLWASLLVIESGFIISASIPNYANLEIFVSFSEETDDDGNNYWAIDSAQVKYSLISSGTKLYKHFIHGDGVSATLTIISTKSDNMTGENSVLEILNTLPAINIDGYIVDDGNYYSFIKRGITDNEMFIGYDEDNTVLDFIAIPSANEQYLDTVTEL